MTTFTDANGYFIAEVEPGNHDITVTVGSATVYSGLFSVLDEEPLDLGSLDPTIPGRIWYKDADEDLFSDGTSIYSETETAEYYSTSSLTAVAGDCDDDDTDVYPGADEICGGHIDQDCSGADLPCSPIDMAYIPAGCFNMGDSFNEGYIDELPVHEVCFSNDFFMDVHEVTNGEYEECVNASVCSAPSSTILYDAPEYADFPVAYVTWWQANTYCISASKRLPTEAECECAARGGLEGQRYAWGNTLIPTDANFYLNYDPWETGPSPVESFAPNNYGLYDVMGNVWELVADWYSATYYQEVPVSSYDPQEPETGTERVMRGGAWSDPSWFLRVASRDARGPTIVSSAISFRCARD